MTTMRRVPPPALVHTTVVVFLAYTFACCSSSSKTTDGLEKYDGYDYADEASFNRSYEETYRAALGSLEDMGFTITVGDEGSGEIRAEDQRTELRPEEERVTEQSGNSDVGFLEILAAVVLAIVMFFISGDTSTSDEDQSEDWKDEGTPRKDYVYVMTLKVLPAGPESATVTVVASRFDYEDAELVGSKDLENKYLNHRLFDRIEELLTAAETLPDDR